MGRSGHHRVLEDQHGSNRQYVQDDLSLPGIVLVSAVVQRLAYAGEGDRRLPFRIEHGDARKIDQRAMTGAGGFEVAPDG